MTASYIETLIARRDALPRTSPCRGAIYRIIKERKNEELREELFWIAVARDLESSCRDLAVSNV
jgi:hypothetical protein